MAARPRYCQPSGHARFVETGPTAYESHEQRLADKRFYASLRWLKKRRWILSQHPLCARCLANDLTVLAVHVHHLVDRKKAPELAFEDSNLQPLCQPCHNAVRHEND